MPWKGPICEWDHVLFCRIDGEIFAQADAQFWHHILQHQLVPFTRRIHLSVSGVNKRLTSCFHRDSSSGKPSLTTQCRITDRIRRFAPSSISSTRAPSMGSHGKTTPARDFCLRPALGGRASHSSTACLTLGKMSWSMTLSRINVGNMGFQDSNKWTASLGAVAFQSLLLSAKQILEDSLDGGSDLWQPKRPQETLPSSHFPVFVYLLIGRQLVSLLPLLERR